jgi:hypothetical protein
LFFCSIFSLILRSDDDILGLKSTFDRQMCLPATHEVLFQLPVLLSLLTSLVNECESAWPLVALLSVTKRARAAAQWAVLRDAVRARMSDGDVLQPCATCCATEQAAFVNAHAQLRLAMVLQRVQSPRAQVTLGIVSQAQRSASSGGSGSDDHPAISAAPAVPMGFRARGDLALDEVRSMMLLRDDATVRGFKFFPASAASEIEAVFAAIRGVARSWRANEDLCLWQLPLPALSSSGLMQATFVLLSAAEGQAIQIQLTDVRQFSVSSMP